MTAWSRFHSGPYLEVANVERIAVFRALHLGDFLCSVPALRALKERYPRSEVTLIGLPWIRSITDRYDYVDRFLEFPGYRRLEGVPCEPSRTAVFLEEARSYGFDLAIQMHGDGRLSNGFVARLGARASVGYRPEGVQRDRELDLELEGVSSDHEIDRWLRLVGAFGATGSRWLDFPLTTDDWIEAERVARCVGMEMQRPMVAIHPGAKEPAKRWPPQRFAVVADRLAAELGAQVAITGVVGEEAIACEVARGMQARSFVLVGRTSVGGLAALFAQMRVVVTNDTGPSHLAAAVRTPTVIIFGPTDPARWSPPDARAHRSVWSGAGKPISCVQVSQVVAEALAVVER